MKTALRRMYQRLFTAFGPQQWWPAETPFEVMVGAILTQNTNWTNVEKAIRNLKGARVLTPQALRRLTPARLSRLIRPAGYYNVKAKRLRHFLDYFCRRYGGDPRKMMLREAARLRKELLAVNGIGPETADSILLYALGKPVFVVDAYTKRILGRHGLAPASADYSTVQALFQENLCRRPQFFNEYHALLVRLGKEYCRTSKPRCTSCPLGRPRFMRSDRRNHA